MHAVLWGFVDESRGAYGQGTAKSILAQEQTAIDAILQQNNG